MVTSAPATRRLLNAAEYAQLPDRGIPTELVRGRVVEMNVPAPRHGEIGANITTLINPHVRGKGMGRVVSNDGGIVTERDPDTVRGGDVAYYSYARVPQGPLPAGSDELPRTLHADDELHFPDILGDLRIPARRFFE